MIPLFSPSQTIKADNYAIGKLGIPGIVLMENASLSIFNIIYDNFSSVLGENAEIGIVCGKGNNGGDGFAAARHFINRGFKVIIVSLAAEKNIAGDALVNYKILKNLIADTRGSEIIHFKSIRDLNKLKNCALVLDAILGTGAKGGLREPYLSIVRKLNSLPSYKVSIDIPTGVDAEKGYSKEAFRADLTVSLAEFKKGLFFGIGKQFSGKVEKGSIGIGGEYFDRLDVKEYLIEPEDAYAGIPLRDDFAHKYSAGRALTVAGSSRFPGAAAFTSNSVLISGAGASYLAAPSSIINGLIPKLNGSTLIPFGDKNEGYLNSDSINSISEYFSKTDVLIIGPGLGRKPETLAAAKDIIFSFNGFKVIDADAVYALKGVKLSGGKLNGSVLTPHHKEFAELLDISVDELAADLLKFGKDFSVETGAAVVLKGAPTIIFIPAGEAFINTAGNSGMAKFGSGDVLTGIIGGFISQNKELTDSIISAVYLHSLSADLLLKEKTNLSLLAEDIINNFPNAVRFLSDSII